MGHARLALPQQRFVKPVGLFGSAAQQVALVGPLVEFLGDRKEDLRAEGFVGLGIADVA